MLSCACSAQTSTAHSPHSAPEPVQEQWIYCAFAGQIIHGNGLTCPKSTALMVQVLTICVVCGSEIWPFPFIFYL